MTDKEIVRTSKFLSLILRHEPERVGLTLDSGGWVSVEELLGAVNRNGIALSREQLEHIVVTSDKKRLALSGDGQRIRASQGHSVAVDLQYEPQSPPELLYHGTATRFLDSIRQHGLQKMKRHDVHLSLDAKTAVAVGGRHGKPLHLIIRAGEMHRAGHIFRRSTNGVWLVDYVPANFIEFPSPS
jgi:putative RNA 2'-phosphotransferase